MSTESHHSSTARIEQAVVASALWAAVGDALGWISELTDQAGLQHRLYGEASFPRPVEWRRRIGGRFGVVVPLPAGTYSDDTQLRLAVSRATRGDGEFDVEAFAKVELPLWTAYALGAGKGTSAAATNLAKSSVSWFTNFFGGKGRASYFDTGGNGAAMRIQPHAWKAGDGGSASLLRDVLRDAIVTHGHPQGFCGAAFHALCVEHALHRRSIPGPDEWVHMLRQLARVPEVLASDQQIRLLWLPAWEDHCREDLGRAISTLIEGALRRLEQVGGPLNHDGALGYEAILAAFGGRHPETRGSGLGTALIAATLSWLHRSTSNEAALLQAATALESDTDTIATMAGAILGAARPEPVDWPLQDRSYITEEATRLARIAQGRREATFAYPDIMNWEPPASQLDAVAELQGGLVLRGLASAEADGPTWISGGSVWQWLRLDFGQTVLAKRRSSPRTARDRDVPTRRTTKPSAPVAATLFDRMRTSETEQQQGDIGAAASAPARRAEPQEVRSSGGLAPPPRDSDLDTLSDWVIKTDFDPTIIGEVFVELSNRERPVETAVAFAAIIAKAIVARRRRAAAKD